MTESDWETNSTRPRQMLRLAIKHASGRQMQLLSCAICRIVWDAIPTPHCQAAVAAAERLVDGVLSPQEFQAFRFGAIQQTEQILNSFHQQVAQSRFELHTDPLTGNTLSQIQKLRLQMAAADLVMACLAENLKQGLQQQLRFLEMMLLHSGIMMQGSCINFDPPLPNVPRRSELTAMICDRIREIVFNPFRMREHHDLIPLPPSTREMAEGCFHDQAFERLPILADALEDSGYPDVEVLQHFRSDGQHVRGCWALDRVLRGR